MFIPKDANISGDFRRETSSHSPCKKQPYSAYSDTNGKAKSHFGCDRRSLGQNNEVRSCGDTPTFRFSAAFRSQAIFSVFIDEPSSSSVRNAHGWQRKATNGW